MRLFLTVLFLVSFSSFCIAEQGTVYYCVNGVSTSIKHGSDKVDFSFEIEKFTFKVTKDRIKFRRSALFSGSKKMDLMFREIDGEYLVARAMDSEDKWYSLSSLILKRGKFSLSFTMEDGLLYYTASCSKS